MTMDAEAIGRSIAARSWRLRFPPDVEASFEEETREERCRTTIRYNYVGIAIYNAFLIGDWLLVRDVFVISLCLHLLVMTPIMGAVIYVLMQRPPSWLREGILAGGAVLGTAAILGLMLLSNSPLRSSEHNSVVLVILFATFVQRIRFPYVVTAGLVSFVLYASALAALATHEPQRAPVAIAVFAVAVLFSLIGCYNLEYEQRMSYLLGLRDRLRSQELELISQRDPLTGLGNRRALDLAIAKRQAAERSDRVVDAAVLIIDVDYFKTYNDDNGHLAGDDCLRRIAAIVGDDVRLGRDRTFRFGGEEFLVLLDNVTASEAQRIGEHVRLAVEDDAIPRGPGRTGVMTVSVGVASGPCLARAIADADRALYAAKNAGRNRARRFQREELSAAFGRDVA
jgi:diguanylate cyclase (GGDEF)-like protein